jgi:acetolactate synthase-1/3 small subunit
LEVTGDHGKLNACIEAFKPYGVIEIAGSGSVALSRSGFLTGNSESPHNCV